jgi:hypothetical protein
MHTILIRITPVRDNKNVHMRVFLNGHACSSNVQYLENLFYFLKNRVLPVGRIPNLDFNPKAFPPETFYYLLEP